MVGKCDIYWIKGKLHFPCKPGVPYTKAYHIGLYVFPIIYFKIVIILY